MNNKYDRQIRLWSTTGQLALQKSHVIVLGGGVACSEAVKNVVLSGLGRITLVGDEIVTAVDVATNFFIRKSDIGRNCAETLAEMLGELNPDVQLHAIPNSVGSLLASADAAFWRQFHVIVVNSRVQIHELDGFLPSIAKPPIVSIDSFGFYGRVRVFFTQQTSFETHPESLVDLRFGENSWSEFKAFVQSIDLESLRDYEHENVPFVVLLEKATDQWRLEHNGRLPETYAQKREFKQHVSQLARQFEQENVEEALKAVWRVWVPSLSSGLEEILQLPEAERPNTEFWVLVYTLKLFVQKFGIPPLNAVIPDMRADSESYAKLKRIYQDKADSDFNEFIVLLDQVISKNAFSPIEPATVRLFIKNARHIRVINGIPIEQDNARIIENYTGELAEEDSQLYNHTNIFLALEAAVNLMQTLALTSWPVDENTVDTLLLTVTKMVGKEPPAELRSVIQEITRSGGGEIHSVASFIGAVAAQEVLKLIMKQYTPIGHTFVYDGTTASSYTFQNATVLN